MAEKYTGAVCYVGQDQEAADGRALEGGWHYAVVEGPDGYDMPDADRKLVVDPDSGEFREATADDASHYETHHQQLKLIAPGGGLGEPRTAEEIEATRRHLDELEQRVVAGDLDPHERDHILTSTQQIAQARQWVSTLGEGT